MNVYNKRHDNLIICERVQVHVELCVRCGWTNLNSCSVQKRSEAWTSVQIKPFSLTAYASSMTLMTTTSSHACVGSLWPHLTQNTNSAWRVIAGQNFGWVKILRILKTWYVTQILSLLIYGKRIRKNPTLFDNCSKYII